MPWQSTSYTALLFITTGVLVALALYARQRRATVGAIAFMWLALVVAEWALTYALELAGSSMPAKVLWAKLQYLGIASTPLAWLIFTLHYTGKARWLTRRNLALLLILPVITLLLVFTNEAHGLIWSHIDVAATRPFQPLDLSHGPWFWVYIAFSYLLILLGSILLVQTIMRSRNLYRRQAGALLLSAAAPWIGNALYISHLNPLQPLDLTPAGFALSAMAVGWALFRFRLLDLVPVAHSAVVAGMQDGIVVLDVQGRVIDLNPSAERILGRGVSAALGQSVERLLAGQPDLVERCYGVTEARIEVMLGEREEQRNYDVQISPLLDRHGQISGRLVIWRDVTERRQAEAALQAAKEAAEHATRAKSEFLANMSHEIRTPMNGVIGMTSLLSETDLDAEQREFVEIIRTSGAALLKVINDILDFSKIESGKLDLELAPFHLQLCLEESLDLVAIKAAEKQLDLAYSIDPHVPITLLGDSARLRQILVNLLNNAVKFTDSGEVVVSVVSRPLSVISSQVQRTTDNGQWTTAQYEMHFAVKDTGIGIPPDKLDLLFTSFSQIDPAATRPNDGTGLGLAISKRLSEIMGGTMWVESEVGHGSTFYFTIMAEAAPSQARVYLPGPTPALTGKRLLIVDDNVHNRHMLSRQAQAWGMLTRDTSSGAEALDWIRAGDPLDVAVLAMPMPDMDGLTLATEIRNYRDPQALPLVILTSLSQREEGLKAIRRSVQAILNKPIKLSQLHAALMNIFEQPPTRTSHAAPQTRIDAQQVEDVPMRMLLAEDDTVNQKLTLILLQKMGYRADVAGNGLEAIQALERQPYDVVLLDVQMPDMDGLEVARYICQNWPQEQRPYLIAVTANAMQGDREQCLNAGMDDYVSKPLHVEELSSAIATFRSRSSRTPASAAPAPVTTAERSLSNTDAAPLAPAAIDAQALGKVREMLGENGPQLLAEIIDSYHDDTARLLATMHGAVGQRDARALQQAAHKLKSSSALLSATLLADLCSELERIGRTGTTVGCLDRVLQIEAEYARVKAALELERVDIPKSVPLQLDQERG